MIEPLTSITDIHTQGPIVIVLDALDECGDDKSREVLLSHMVDGFRKLPSAFRIFITSRPESDIKLSFDSQPNILACELDVSSEFSKGDVLTYLAHNMDAIRQRNKYLRLSVDWPGALRTQLLAEHSAGLFIYAATAVKFLLDGQDPEERLGILLSTKRRAEAESSLDELYTVALRCAGKWDDTTFVSDFSAIMGVILVAKNPLSNKAIDQLLDTVRPSIHTVARLGCVLQWGLEQPVQIAHKSFADFLTSRGRCGTNPWFIDTEFHNHNLTATCLQFMKQEIRFNICRLETSHLFNFNVPDLGNRVHEFISDRLLYSCVFWADHLRETTFDTSIIDAVADFLHLRFLFWLEVLSIIQRVDIAAEALMTVASWTKVRTVVLATTGVHVLSGP